MGVAASRLRAAAGLDGNQLCTACLTRVRPNSQISPPPLLASSSTSLSASVRRRRRQEPKPEGELTDPPADLTPVQAEVWRYVIAHAPRGLLKPLDLGPRAQRLTVPMAAAVARRVVP